MIARARLNSPMTIDVADPIADLKPGQAVLVDWTAERYHADTETVSRSQLEDLRASPALYHARHVARTLPPDSPGPAMRLGTNVHMAVLEPEEWRRRTEYRPAPEKPQRPEGADGRAKAGTSARDLYECWKDDCDDWESALRDWAASRPADMIDLSVAERDRIEAIAASVRAHPFASILLGESGDNEQTVLWRPSIDQLSVTMAAMQTDPILAENPPMVRLRADRIRQMDGSTRVVTDLKTTQDPSPRAFGNSIARYGYHRQGAIYTDAVQALYPGEELHFVLIVVRSSPPYEVACYELDPEDLALGRAQYLATMADLIRRRAENDWIAEWQGWCSGITIPAWAHKET